MGKMFLKELLLHILGKEMAYKRYFYRNGKKFGPYYYESYRDKNGDVKKRYIGKINPDKKKIPVGKLVLGGLILFVVLIVSAQVLLWETGDGLRETGDGFVGSVKGFASNSISRIVGFVVDGSQSSPLQVLSEEGKIADGSPSADDSQQEVVDDSSADADEGLVDEVVVSQEGVVDEDIVVVLGGVEEIVDEVDENVSAVLDENDSVDENVSEVDENERG